MSCVSSLHFHVTKLRFGFSNIGEIISMNDFPETFLTNDPGVRNSHPTPQHYPLVFESFVGFTKQ